MDDVNDVLLQQVIAGDKSTVIKTENYDIKLAKRSIKDLMMNEKSNDTKLPLELQDIAHLVQNTNRTEQSVLGLTVRCLKIYIKPATRPISFSEYARSQVRLNRDLKIYDAVLIYKYRKKLFGI